MMEVNSQQRRLSQFIANKEAFSAISGEVDSNKDSSIPQPVLIIGQEGSGKTTLLKRVTATYTQLPFVWIVGRPIFNTNDIIDRIADSRILIIDNLDYYLDRCSYDEQYRLRRFLYEEGAPMLIASVRKLSPALTEYKAPFFEGLKKIHLSPIYIEDIAPLFDEKTIERVKTMFNLTSPTIKSVEIISDIIESGSDQNKDIGALLSYFSDMYSLKYQSVPITSQHILNILGTSDTSLTISEIRDKSNLASGILSPYLKNLCQQGIATADKSLKRNTKYFVSDPLFRIWLKDLDRL